MSRPPEYDPDQGDLFRADMEFLAGLLVRNGQRVNASTLADRAGRYRETVAKYLHQFQVDPRVLESEARRQVMCSTGFLPQ